MSFWKKLFGGEKTSKAAPPVEHNGFLVTVDPIREGTRWRVAALIEKEIDGEMKSHRMIRADTIETEEVAREITLNKARATIDQLGDTLFR